MEVESSQQISTKLHRCVTNEMMKPPVNNTGLEAKNSIEYLFAFNWIEGDEVGSEFIQREVLYFGTGKAE